MTLERNNLVLTRANGAVEHSVFVTRDDGRIEHLVHLSVLPSGHASVVDYDAHLDSAGGRAYHHPDPPELTADKVKRFLALDAERLGRGLGSMIGHPNSQPSRQLEVERLTAKHGL